MLEETVREWTADWVAEGREQGLEQGREQGIEQGRAEERALLCRLAGGKFDDAAGRRLAAALAEVGRRGAAGGGRRLDHRVRDGGRTAGPRRPVRS